MYLLFIPIFDPLIKSFKYRLDLSEAQKGFFNCVFGSCRFIYNRSLSERNEAYQKDNTRIGAVDLIKRITVLKKQDGFEWLKKVPNQCLQQAIWNMDSAFTRFFREKASFPRFRTKHENQSCQFVEDLRINFETKKIKIPKLGWVRVFIDREFEGRIGTCTVSRNSCGMYFISIVVHIVEEIPPKVPIKEETTVGIDVGIKTFATLSTGEKVENPRHLRNGSKRLAVLQRRMSRKQKGSKRREKAKKAVAKCHYRIGCQRNDFLHKLSSKLVRENQALVIEDLNVGGMRQNHKLARSVSDAAWSEFFRQLRYKCEWSGKNLITIGRFEPSSKMCTCGVINKELMLKHRNWTCASCGVAHDRDILAANNIKRFGLQAQNLIGITGKAIPEEDVELLAVAGAVKRQGA
jgi:putative transposase